MWESGRVQTTTGADTEAMEMKLYSLLLVAVLMLVVSVSGYQSLDFQNPSDFNGQVSCMGSAGSCSWTQNTIGGNSYALATAYGVSQRMHIANVEALPMTYAACTVREAPGMFGFYSLTLYNSTGTAIWIITPVLSGVGTRQEIKVIGGIAHFYEDGTNTQNSTILDQNPSYIGFGAMGNPTHSAGYDDCIWGDTGSKYIFGMPELGYFLQKDLLNPAASGFYRVNQTNPNGSPVLITSNTFTSTFGKPNGNNQTVVLASPTGGDGLSYNTGTAYAGQITWNLTQFFAQPTTGYGLYQTGIESQPDSNGFAVSEWIPYIGAGASITFDKNSYAIGETATMTVIISDDYYDAVTDPHVKLLDPFATEINDDTSIEFTEQPNGDWLGTSTYTWTDDNDEGVYFGAIYATYEDKDVLMNFDTAELNSNLIITGYVFNAETATVISGATVNVTQGTTTDSLTTAADGNYSTVSTFSANSPTTIVASKSGFETYSHTFTPLYAGSIQINLTLMPTNPTYTGIALGGIARTPPYNRTINSARVDIVNATDGHIYNATTNSVGYYIQNNMAGASHWFDVWGSKVGFSNSTVYQKLVVGI